MVKEANLKASYRNDEYEQAVINSSLWAAAGDALGWMTELSRGQDGVRYRTGKTRVTAPVAWQRTIGGRGGVRVELPAGTYSDDTQLRLTARLLADIGDENAPRRSRPNTGARYVKTRSYYR